MNDFFETQDDNIIDFTESNPFGDIEDNMLGQQFYHETMRKVVMLLVLFSIILILSEQIVLVQ